MTKVIDESYPKTTNLSDQEIKDRFAAEHQAAQRSTPSTVPTEIIRLPSKGWFYPEGHPLAAGEVEMKYMTAVEENILSTQSLIRSGKVFDKLMQALMVTDFNYGDLLLMDKSAIFINARVLAYGSDYDVEIECPNCGKSQNHVVDLTQFQTSEIDWSAFTKGTNEYQFKLPKADKILTLKFLTYDDEQAIEKDLEGARKLTAVTGIDTELTTRLRALVVAVDGSTDRADINNTINGLLGPDSLALRKHIKQVTPELDTTYTFQCNSCDFQKSDVALAPDLSFFWPGV